MLGYRDGLVLWTPNRETGGDFRSVGQLTYPNWGTLNGRGDVMSDEGVFPLGMSRSVSWPFVTVPPRMNNLGWITGVRGPYGESLWNGKDYVVSPRFAGSVDINDTGQVITRSGWLYAPPLPATGSGTFSHIGDVPDYPSMTAAVISRAGTVAGQVCASSAPDCPERVFIWRPAKPNGSTGTLALLPLPDGYASMHAKAINRLGFIVGRMTTNSGIAVPFLYDGARVYDLTVLIPSLLRQDSEAHGINDAGQILVGSITGILSGGSARTEAVAYILDPLPARTVSPIEVEIRSDSLEPIPSDLQAQPFEVTGSGCSAGRYTTPVRISWAPGAQCSVSFAAERMLSPTYRLLFAGWSDGEAAATRQLQPTSDMTLSARFVPQVRRRVNYRIEAGTIEGLDVWATDGGIAELTARAKPGYRFMGWQTPYGLSWPFNRFRVRLPIDEDIYAFFEEGVDSGPRYQVTPLGNVSASGYGRALNSSGQLALNWGAVPYLWQPRPDAPAFGDWLPVEGLRVEDGYRISDLSDAGELLLTTTYANTSLWRPTAPGSAQGALQGLGDALDSRVFFNGDGRIGPLQSGGALFEIDLAGNQFPLSDFWRNAPAFSRRNKKGQAVAWDRYTGTALLLAPYPGNPTGGFLSIAPPPGVAKVWPVALNDFGQIIGSDCGSTSWCNRGKGFIWTPSVPNGITGSWRQLDIPKGADFLIPTAINNRGEVVGYMGETARDGDPRSDSAFIFDGSHVMLLPATGIPNWINDRGQILMLGTFSQLLTPWIEPAPAGAGVDVMISTAVVTAAAQPQLNALNTPFRVTGAGCAPGMYPAQTSLVWSAGAVCEVEFIAEAPNGARRTKFVRWSDGGHDESPPDRGKCRGDVHGGV